MTNHQTNMKLIRNLRRATDVTYDCDECFFIEGYWCDYHLDLWNEAFDALDQLWK